MAVQGGLSLGAPLFVAVCLCHEGATAAYICQEADGFWKDKLDAHDAHLAIGARAESGGSILLSTRIVSCSGNGQEGNCGLLEQHGTGGHRPAFDCRQLIPCGKPQRAAVQPDIGIH
jgi:hypothetical protein